MLGGRGSRENALNNPCDVMFNQTLLVGMHHPYLNPCHPSVGLGGGVPNPGLPFPHMQGKQDPILWKDTDLNSEKNPDTAPILNKFLISLY